MGVWQLEWDITVFELRGKEECCWVICLQKKWLYTKSTAIESASHLIMCKNKNICQSK